jgi:Fe-S oxidoreductase
LKDIRANHHLDLARLLVGSEGTLALFTETTLRTLPLPGGRSLVLLAFDSLETALRATQRVLATEPAACDLIDHRLLTLARGADPELAHLVPAGAEVILLVEFEADSSIEAKEKALALEDKVYQSERLAWYAVSAWQRETIDRLWRLRESALPSLYSLRGKAQPVPLIEDVGVPVEELLPFLRRVQDLLQRYETTASFLVHAGAGQVHTRPFLDLDQPAEVTKLWAIEEEVHALALELGGTVSSQHGTGLARTPWISRQYGDLALVFRDLKAIFDPHQIFNPDKIVGPETRPSRWLRRPCQALPEPSLPNGSGSTHSENTAPAGAAPLTTLRWLKSELPQEVSQCNGCGHCRTQVSALRMCPIFHASGTEAATPRAKANLLRHVLAEESDSRLLSSNDVRAVADLCVNCKMCARECPAHVNIPKLMLEAKAANVAEHGLDRSEWVLARVESFAAAGSALAFLANAGLASRTVRWILEKVFGVSRQRRLPTFAARNFLRQARQRGWMHVPKPYRPRVAYFVDVFANYNDPQLAEAVVAVLHHQGIEVYVPPGQTGCGMAPLAQGDVETAREMAQRNLRVLAELAREGYPILCSEPTAALMLKQDYLDLLDDPDARLVANITVELTAYLWSLYEQGELRTDFQPLRLSLGHHVPCHLKALGNVSAGPALLALIPGLQVRTIDVSCSGMAGTYGLKAENYAVSLEAGRPMLEELARPAISFGSTECSACRMQMENGSRKRALHPVQYLALAYGLMPELARRLEQPIQELVLS